MDTKPDDFLFHATPKKDFCDHDFQGWRDLHDDFRRIPLRRRMLVTSVCYRLEGVVAGMLVMSRHASRAFKSLMRTRQKNMSKYRTNVDMKDEIERLREYACHRIGCARLKEPSAKCDCGLADLLGAECETCGDDPEVCASIPGLRHCEKANRNQDG